jgi:serine/threonine protein phosphatase PrpC
MVSVPADIWVEWWASAGPRARSKWAELVAARGGAKETILETTLRRQQLPPRLVIDSAAKTDTGLVRSVNEDSVLDLGARGVWAVADGVGGADAGDWASREIVNALAGLPNMGAIAERISLAKAALDGVNAHLLSAAARIGSRRGIASTVVCLLIHEERFACVWAGDSRLYLLRRGEFTQVSHDHSAVQAMVDAGLITDEEARHHPSANTITRAVGVEAMLRLDCKEGTVEPGDIFLICTDGLTKVVDDHEIACVLADYEPAEAVGELVRMTLDRGAPDNVSIVVVRATRAEGNGF